MLTQEFWDARYRSAESIWSGNPNPHLLAHVLEVALLLAQEFFASDEAVAGTNPLDVQLLHFFHGANPRSRVGMAHIIEGTIDAGIASAEDAVPG